MRWKPSNEPVRYDKNRVATFRPVTESVAELPLPLIRSRKLRGIANAIEMQIEDPGALVGSCGFRYSCVYKNTISWANPTTPLPMERDPRVVFERLFGDGATAEERMRRRALDRSILDRITGKAAQLKLVL